MDDVELLHSAQIAAIQASVARIVEDNVLMKAEISALQANGVKQGNLIQLLINLNDDVQADLKVLNRQVDLLDAAIAGDDGK